ncbi:hypothetical protein QYE76_048114 [Lolium multiflorum]|uniref:Uncharacterized protein n=1 Tax=Lolium multiflorum TaxID=4521 RepID=A0AAD8TT56_LOLMU|nr:hypothetical protein QYE76_048114 [Lolium multiflorum]
MAPAGEATEEEAWAQVDMSAMRRSLLSLIHRYYLEAISRLPAADLRATLARGLLVAGHCYGPLHPVHNILLNSIWYAAAFALRDADRIDVDMISNDGVVRACHRSLDGLVASLRHFCPRLSTGDALWNLMSADADLSAAVALANRTSRSSAQRAMGSEAHGTFQAAAMAARHPNPAAFGLFSSSVLPTVKRDIVLFLRTTHMLSPMDIERLTKSLVPDSPNDLLQPPLTISPGVLDAITSHRKLFKDTQEAVLKVVTVALGKYTLQSGEQFVLHSVCGVNLLEKERLDNCYHINFFAHRQESGSVLGAPLLFFTEALVPAFDDSSIRLCVVVDPLTEIGSCFACETNKKKIVHPTYDEYLGGRDFQVDDVDNDGDFPNPLDVDYIFFDAERDSAFAKHLDDIATCDKGGSTDVLGTARPYYDVDLGILTGRWSLIASHHLPGRTDNEIKNY